MNITEWIPLFGRPADDPEVSALLAKITISSPVALTDDETSVTRDAQGTGGTVTFTDATVLRPDDPDAVVGVPILTEVVAIIDDRFDPDNRYVGPLPFGLRPEDSRDVLRSRLGEPESSNERTRSDTWTLDGLELNVGYTPDFVALRDLSVTLPRPE